MSLPIIKQKNQIKIIAIGWTQTRGMYINDSDHRTNHKYETQKLKNISTIKKKAKHMILYTKHFPLHISAWYISHLGVLNINLLNP
jgi:hypothetical protein